MVDQNESILNSIKKLIGFDADYTAFDLDLTLHINSAFATLHQLGVGPREEFEIEDAEARWADFIGPIPGIKSVRTYVFTSVKLIFDPPATSYAQDALKARLEELTWRLTSAAEHYYNPPVVVAPVVGEI